MLECKVRHNKLVIREALKSVRLVREVMMSGHTPSPSPRTMSPTVLLQTYERKPKEWEEGMGPSVGNIVRHFEHLKEGKGNEEWGRFGRRSKTNSGESRNESRSSGIVSDEEELPRPSESPSILYGENLDEEITPTGTPDFSPRPSLSWGVEEVGQTIGLDSIAIFEESETTSRSSFLQTFFSFSLFLSLAINGSYGAYLLFLKMNETTEGVVGWEYIPYLFGGQVIILFGWYWFLGVVGAYIPGLFTNFVLITLQPSLYLLSSSSVSPTRKISTQVQESEISSHLEVDFEDSGYVEGEESPLPKNNNMDSWFASENEEIEEDEREFKETTNKPKSFLLISLCLGVIQLGLIVIPSLFIPLIDPLFSFLVFGQLSQFILLLILAPLLRLISWSRGSKEKEE